MNRIDPTTPIHQQPLFILRHGWKGVRRDHPHHWFMYVNGVECGGCRRLALRLDGRWRYKGKHRR